MDDNSRNLDQQLREAYLATTYEVKQLGIFLKIGESNWHMEEFLVDNNVFTWAFISAYNPYSKDFSLLENEKRHTQLVSEVKKMDLVFAEGFGVPANEDWKAEKSLLILDISKEDAITLGKRWEQNAIVWGRLGGEPELVFMS